jgi:large subunit ribosomal protein L31
VVVLARRTVGLNGRTSTRGAMEYPLFGGCCRRRQAVWQTSWSSPAPVHPERIRGPGGHRERARSVKTGIHPEYVVTEVVCGCGNSFTTRSTKKSGSIHVEVCSNCHPFYTGKQKILDTGGRVARFEARYGKRQKSK